MAEECLQTYRRCRGLMKKPCPVGKLEIKAKRPKHNTSTASSWLSLVSTTILKLRSSIEALRSGRWRFKMNAYSSKLQKKMKSATRSKKTGPKCKLCWKRLPPKSNFWKLFTARYMGHRYSRWMSKTKEMQS